MHGPNRARGFVRLGSESGQATDGVGPHLLVRVGTRHVSQ
jgi:hypothetical protein